MLITIDLHTNSHKYSVTAGFRICDLWATWECCWIWSGVVIRAASGWRSAHVGHADLCIVLVSCLVKTPPPVSNSERNWKLAIVGWKCRGLLAWSARTRPAAPFTFILFRTSDTVVDL